jgi:hypothetical protein
VKIKDLQIGELVTTEDGARWSVTGFDEDMETVDLVAWKGDEKRHDVSPLDLELDGDRAPMATSLYAAVSIPDGMQPLRAYQEVAVAASHLARRGCKAIRVIKAEDRESATSVTLVGFRD